MPGPVKRIDDILGWPFRKLLVLLMKITGQDNFWHAQCALVLAGSLTATGGVVIYQRNPSATALALIGIEGFVGFSLVLSGYYYSEYFRKRSQSSSLGANDWLAYTVTNVMVIPGRILMASMSIGFMPWAIYSRDLVSLVPDLSLLSFAAGFYFLTDDQPKQPGWITKLASLFGAKPGHAEPT